ncbi:enoyl-CoA hydratase/isomerase family protein [Alkalimarinus coralli]|uniref:enoyl-CoA hydratase/isomerase family protein n=1 Tax=Alkalimarinus coralli TaxID=2935863 RepID=UPI00202B2D33|nr:enoyl-CoA hydratase-related protein [Alkalimarinus coralli]
MSGDTKQFEDVVLNIDAGVAYITINRPEKLNAIRIQTYQDIIAALKEADQNDQCNVLIVSGAEGKFTAGNDLADLVSGQADQVMAGVQGIFDALSSLNKPLIAAVESVAVGIGTTLLLHCDMVIASTGTKFRMPFANLGVSPEGASSALLSSTIGSKAASELLLTGRFFSAEEASMWGLVNQVSDKGQAMEVAQGVAKQLLKQPLPSLIATKAELRKYLPYNVSDVVAAELKTFVRLLESEETQARINAMVSR